MEQRLITIILLALTLVAGCAGPETCRDYEAPLEKAVDISDIVGENTFENATIHGESLYYLARDGAKGYQVICVDGEGSKKALFRIPLGKGPGEIAHASGIIVDNGILAIADLRQKKISQFTLQGDFIDSISYHDSNGEISSFDIDRNVVYFYGDGKILLGAYDLEAGVLLGSLERDTVKIPQPGDVVTSCVITVDRYTGDLFAGHFSQPYRIDRYDGRLRKKGTITLDTRGAYGKAFYIPGMNVEGDVAISSLATDEKFIYAPFLSARLDFKEGGFSFIPFDVEIMAFPKEGGGFPVKYKNQLLVGHEGIVSVLGTTRSAVAVMINGKGKVLGGLLQNDGNQWQTAVVFLKKNRDDNAVR